MTFTSSSRSKWFFRVVTVLLFSTGCAVGPNFKRPAAPTVTGYTPTLITTISSTPGVKSGETQHIIEGHDIAGDWWNLFHSKPLNDLIERSLKANPDLKSAQAALMVARENVVAQKGFYYPSAGASFSASRQTTSNELSPVPNASVFNFSLFTPQVNVAFVPDVFGLNRRTVESLKAEEEQTRFALIATHITLSSNVAAAAIQEASLRAQIDATQQLITINTDMLQVLRNQFAKGYVSRLDVAAQESQLAQVAATLPPLMKQLAQQRDLLVRLSGGYPNQDLAEKFDLASLQLPEDLPLSLPSKLIEQRPDVRQAEENLHFASAQIGVAMANRLPSFPLSANVGSTAVMLTSLFASGTGFWQLGAAVTQPIFSGGTLLHRQRAAEAAYAQAGEQYKSAVLTAFQNVADTLNALQQDADALKTAAAARDAAGVTLDLAKQQYKSGYANYLSLLNAEQSYQQTVINLTQAQANRYTDTAALFQALGGGWWNRGDLPVQ